ncbi:sodium-dependent glucose transporter 1-like [Brienomyrus brachyistius]|uniref:sodium-dependent glucose transporter 1-like n=1 Tax=Brienomyrus brachyistius TaxID=42636 RepID=UPI0020B39027|nr:sodium-dependent glucose transporter 1-like [Brienomyrus brachyistius]
MRFFFLSQNPPKQYIDPRGPKGVMKKSHRLGTTGTGQGTGAGSSGDCKRWMVTLSLCVSFFGLGMAVSVLGPTLGDLATNVEQNISNISYIFVGRSGGYMLGSMLAGILFDIINHQLLLGFSMALTAFGMLTVPFCKTAPLLAVLMSTVGVSMGSLDTGGNVVILNTWEARSGPHLQALHFSFAAGAFVAPIVAKLLFGDDERPGQTDGLGIWDGQGSTPSAAELTPAFTAEALEASDSMPESMWAYFVIGAFCLLVSLLFFIHFYQNKLSRGTVQATPEKALVVRHHNALVLLLFFFFFWYVGAEVAYGSFIFTFAKDHAGMTEPQAAGLNSLFWGTFAATRGLAIFLSACMGPACMILLSLVGCALSSLLLSIFSRNGAALWSCTAIYGASMATTFPSGISWVEQYTRVTGRSAAIFVVGAALGEMVLPAVVGLLLGTAQGVPVLMYLCLGTAVITSILFLIMYKLATSRSGSGRKNQTVDDSEHIKALKETGINTDKEEGEEEEEGEGETL